MPTRPFSLPLRSARGGRWRARAVPRSKTRAALPSRRPAARSAALPQRPATQRPATHAKRSRVRESGEKKARRRQRPPSGRLRPQPSANGPQFGAATATPAPARYGVRMRAAGGPQKLRYTVASCSGEVRCRSNGSGRGSTSLPATGRPRAARRLPPPRRTWITPRGSCSTIARRRKDGSRRGARAGGGGRAPPPPLPAPHARRRRPPPPAAASRWRWRSSAAPPAARPPERRPGAAGEGPAAAAARRPPARRSCSSPLAPRGRGPRQCGGRRPHLLHTSTWPRRGLPLPPPLAPAARPPRPHPLLPSPPRTESPFPPAASASSRRS